MRVCRKNEARLAKNRRYLRSSATAGDSTDNGTLVRHGTKSTSNPTGSREKARLDAVATFSPSPPPKEERGGVMRHDRFKLKGEAAQTQAATLLSWFEEPRAGRCTPDRQCMPL